ncbi:MAG: Rrf2 family transcriptional regulator, partial [Planctomycetes bacterium]|nr:Rrf2 family transcriptional regulator [Planctomycetota bacterium]
ERYQVSQHHLSKVLQQLVRAGLLTSLRGVGGGHTLARDAKNVTLYDVVEVFEGEHRDDGSCLLQEADQGPCGRPEPCGLGAVFSEIDEQIYFTLRSVSLKTLITRKPHPM